MGVVHKRHVIFGGFDYAVKYEMNQNALYKGIEYFAELDEKLVGREWLGKKIQSIEYLLEDYKNSKEKPLILIGSIIYHTELEMELISRGLERDKDFCWAIDFKGDEFCEPLWKQYEWDSEDNASSRFVSETSEATLTRYKIVEKMIDNNKIHAVIDMGGANGRFESILEDSVSYKCLDYIPYSEKTILCDINKDELPDFGSFPKETCIVMLSFLCYANDWKKFLKDCCDKADTIIIGHNDFVRMNREFRRTSLTWNSIFFNHEIILEMQKNGYILVEAYDYRLRTVIMKFERVNN